MSNLVPDGWSENSIGKYVDASVAGEWGAESDGSENDIPVLRATNFSPSGAIDHRKLAIRSIAEIKRIKKLLKRGDIVLEKSGGSPTQPVGRVIYFDNEKPFLYSNFTQKLSPSKDCNSKYLFYKLYHEYHKGTVFKFQQQTTGIINFQLAEYLLYKTVFPPLPEQQKIAQILTSVDEVIEKTQAQIDKLKDLKTGMMQELLTKGIGHVEFKNSPVGSIPVGWVVRNFASVVKDSNQGVNTTTEKVTYSESGITAIRSNNVEENRLDMRDKKFVSRKMYNRLTDKVKPRLNDVLYCNIGSKLGAAAVVTTDDDMLITWNVLRVSVKATSLVPKYFSYLLNSNRKGLRGVATESTMPFISSKVLSKYEFIIPPLSEQKLIVAILESVDRKSLLADEKLSALKNMKKALMQDLLTGNVRVNTELSNSSLAVD